MKPLRETVAKAVIPAKAGIQAVILLSDALLDSRLRHSGMTVVFQLSLHAFIFIGVCLFLSPTPPVHGEEVYQEITIEPGDTMWGIANKYLKDPRRWPDIVKHNNLSTSDPTIALPGTKIKVPVALVKEEYRNAELVSFVPEVKYKRKGSSDWNPTEEKMILKYEDSLRTMKGAEARVRFPTKEVVQINENSYVVLKPEKILQEIELLKGDIRASRAKVILPQGTVVQPRGVKSDYSAKVREDDTEVVFVYKGKVDVTAQGKTITVPEGFGTHVPKFSPPAQPQPLAHFPDYKPVTADFDKNVPPIKKDGQGRITMAPPKSSPMLATNIFHKYSLQLAKDEAFKQILMEKTLPIGEPFDIKEQKIADGTYFMRVAFIDALGVKGGYADPSPLLKDTEPPLMKDLKPEDGARFKGEEAYCDVVGFVSGASLVSINGEVVFISAEGKFNKFISLEPGTNEIRVVARDTNGNETVRIRKVTYQPN